MSFPIIDAESGDLTTMVDRLNDFMRNMWCIEWCGQFIELCEGTGEFPIKVCGGFYEDEKGGGPIPQDRIGEFKDYLQTYGFRGVGLGEGLIQPADYIVWRNHGK